MQNTNRTRLEKAKQLWQSLEGMRRKVFWRKTIPELFAAEATGEFSDWCCYIDRHEQDGFVGRTFRDANVGTRGGGLTLVLYGIADEEHGIHLYADRLRKVSANCVFGLDSQCGLRTSEPWREKAYKDWNNVKQFREAYAKDVRHHWGCVSDLEVAERISKTGDTYLSILCLDESSIGEVVSWANELEQYWMSAAQAADQARRAALNVKVVVLMLVNTSKKNRGRQDGAKPVAENGVGEARQPVYKLPEFGRITRLHAEEWIEEIVRPSFPLCAMAGMNPSYYCERLRSHVQKLYNNNSTGMTMRELMDGLDTFYCQSEKEHTHGA